APSAPWPSASTAPHVSRAPTTRQICASRLHCSLRWRMKPSPMAKTATPSTSAVAGVGTSAIAPPLTATTPKPTRMLMASEPVSCAARPRRRVASSADSLPSSTSFDRSSVIFMIAPDGDKSPPPRITNRQPSGMPIRAWQPAPRARQILIAEPSVLPRAAARLGLLLQTGQHAVEHPVHVAAEPLNGDDNGQSNAGCEDTVLDGGRPGPVFAETIIKSSHSGPPALYRRLEITRYPLHIRKGDPSKLS